MASEAQHPVVILYEHALLGEGLARYLRAQIGVEATVGSAHDREGVKSALALDPAVVIFESSDRFQQFDLSTLAPHAVLIDVSAVITRGSARSPCVAGLEQILQAVRDSSSTVAGPAETRPVGILGTPTR
ncbi:MAG: hypothetical protein IMZ75_16675 [Actinobacteria bacterium]|nr:hypothetical protein [Actinomycetota bacterium]